MQRVAFVLHVHPDRVVEYTERHAQVWPEMRAALSAAGWSNYSLFLRPDGLLVGYLEAEDFEASLRAMAETEVNADWQREMSPFFVSGPDDGNPDEMMIPLSEVFHLP